MTETAFINLTYLSPYEDMEKSLGFNADGTINNKYTLLAMRELLENNLNVINNLITEADNITHITPVGYGIIEIKMNSAETTKKLIDIDILTIKPNIDSEYEDTTTDDWHIEEHNETNQDRLHMIANLVIPNDTHNLFEIDISSDSDSDNLIVDNKNTNSILGKYSNLLTGEEYDSDDISTCSN